MADEDERLDVPEAIKRLNAALGLQHRSALQYALAAGSLVGIAYQGLGDRLWAFAEEELADGRRLVEKIVALEGEPTTEVAPLRWEADPGKALDWLLSSEADAIERLQDAIAPTGREGSSEALEHLLEHVIMRKQNQLDLLVRARRGA